jgi:DNA polymerase-3 subunit beta
MLIAAGVLSHALKILVRNVPKRSTLPMLENVLFEPVDGDVAITATDLTTQCTVVIPARDPIAVCLSARSLLEFVASVDRDAEAKVALVGGILTVTTKGASVTLPSCPAREFPAPIAHVTRAAKHVDRLELIDALDWVALAVGSDPTRPQLAGVLFEHDRVIATDGHRLHAATVDGLASPRALVPPEALALAVRASAGIKSVAISFDKTSMQLTAGDFTITTRLIDQVFPTWQHVVPTSSTFTMAVESRVLEAGIRRVATRKKVGTVPTITLRANGAIKLETSTDGVARMTDVPVVRSTHVGDADHVTGVSGRFLSDAITDVDGTVTLRFGGELDPIVVERDGEGEIAVVMPCRL